MITISIDLTQLDKSRFKTITRKNGNKATFCDLILFDTPHSEYGDYMVKQQVTKEEREQKVQMPILGNGKILGAPKASSPTSTAPDRTTSDDATDDIPF
jgi:hypothetical protein